MAVVTIDGTPSSASNGSTTSLSWSHTVAGSNRYLLVGISQWINSPQASYECSGVTWNGTSLTLLSRTTLSIHTQVSLWGLLAPATGTFSIVASFPSSVSVVSGGISFNNVGQTIPTGSAAPSSGNGTTASTSVATSSTDELVVGNLAVDSQNSGSTATPDGAQSQKWNAQIGTGSAKVIGAGATKAGTGGSVALTWTIDTARDWILTGVAMLPVGGGPSTMSSVIWVADGEA